MTIQQTERARENAPLLRELTTLAEAIHRRRYWHVKQWRPLDTPRGVLSQIDNMVAGLLDDLEAIPQTSEEVVEAVRRELINTPETADFMAAVPLEAIHQRERWGSEHDAGKTPFDWFWLVGYLAQKAAAAAVAGDTEKALHHTISTAGALANWHAQLSGKSDVMRPGIDAAERKVA